MPKNLLLSFLLTGLLTTTHAQWSTGSLQSPRYGMAAATVGSKAFFAGGIGMISIPPAVYDMYDATNGTWTSGSISTGRFN